MPEDVLGLTAQIVSAHVTKNPVSVEDLPGLIREVYKTLASVGEAAAPVEAAKPAVPVTKSVFPDYVVCLECGKKFRTVRAAERASYHGCPKCGGVDIDIDVTEGRHEALPRNTSPQPRIDQAARPLDSQE